MSLVRYHAVKENPIPRPAKTVRISLGNSLKPEMRIFAAIVYTIK
jgi:hypothetical protein